MFNRSLNWLFEKSRSKVLLWNNLRLDKSWKPASTSPCYLVFLRCQITKAVFLLIIFSLFFSFYWLLTCSHFEITWFPHFLFHFLPLIIIINRSQQSRGLLDHSEIQSLGLYGCPIWWSPGPIWPIWLAKCESPSTSSFHESLSWSHALVKGATFPEWVKDKSMNSIFQNKRKPLIRVPSFELTLTDFRKGDCCV